MSQLPPLNRNPKLRELTGEPSKITVGELVDRLMKPGLIAAGQVLHSHKPHQWSGKARTRELTWLPRRKLLQLLF